MSIIYSLRSPLPCVCWPATQTTPISALSAREKGRFPVSIVCVEPITGVYNRVLPMWPVWSNLMYCPASNPISSMSSSRGLVMRTILWVEGVGGGSTEEPSWAWSVVISSMSTVLPFTTPFSASGTITDSNCCLNCKVQ